MDASTNLQLDPGCLDACHRIPVRGLVQAAAPREPRGAAKAKGRKTTPAAKKPGRRKR